MSIEVAETDAQQDESQSYDDLRCQIYLLPRKNEAMIDTEPDVFGLDLWTLQFASLKFVFKDAIFKYSKDGNSRNYLENILYFLKNAFVNKEIASLSSIDVNEFCDSVKSLSAIATAELMNEPFMAAGFLALNLLYTYIESLKRGIFREFDADDGDYL